MIFVIIGAPGAGKGTQSEKLAEELGAIKMSTGDLLRKHIRDKTPIGLKAQQYMDSGNLVPDEVLIELIRKELPKRADLIVLLDGFPRTAEQAKALESLDSHKVRKAIHVDVPNDELIQRLSGRLFCLNCGSSYHVLKNPPKQAGICGHCGEKLATRSDDAPEKVQVRLGVYERETKPVLEYYKKLGIYQRIDGNQSVDKVFADLMTAAEPLAVGVGG